jgi:hypothetical protein
MVQFGLRRTPSMRRHPERSRFSGGAKDLRLHRGRADWRTAPLHNFPAWYLRTRPSLETLPIRVRSSAAAARFEVIRPDLDAASTSGLTHPLDHETFCPVAPLSSELGYPCAFRRIPNSKKTALGRKRRVYCCPFSSVENTQVRPWHASVHLPPGNWPPTAPGTEP